MLSESYKLSTRFPSRRARNGACIFRDDRWWCALRTVQLCSSPISPPDGESRCFPPLIRRTDTRENGAIPLVTPPPLIYEYVYTYIHYTLCIQSCFTCHPIVSVDSRNNGCWRVVYNHKSNGSVYAKVVAIARCRRIISMKEKRGTVQIVRAILLHKIIIGGRYRELTP